MADTPADELALLWERIRGDLGASIPASTFKLWIEPLRAVGTHGGQLYLTAPEPIRSWVARRYARRIAQSLTRHSASLDSIAFVDPQVAIPESSPSAARAGEPFPLEPDHTFERFVIGPGNRIAHAAALAVAELPGDAYNPLLLHGPPGLGKTHLLTAIALYLRANHPGLNVQWTTAERFTAEFVAALRQDGPERFKERYRTLDALLIDDIQVLEGKERTQEEFVHTFNALHAAGKQIVLSSDRPPQALSRLEERLRDRFEWGLCVPIDPPDLRTRIALAWRLSSTAPGDPPPPEVLREIAARVPANVRLLEGAITRVLAFASLLGEPLEPALVHRALEPPPAGEGSTAVPTIAAIQDAVCHALGVSHADLLSPRRSTRISRARQLAMYLARERTSHSLSEIARQFDRDHTTVVHAIRAVGRRLDPGSETTVMLHQVRSLLGESAASPSLEPPSRPEHRR